MAASKGNQFWKLRSKHGRDKIIESPEILLQSALEYFESVDNNPIKVQDNKGTKNVNEVSLIRPYTKKGLCIFLDICENTYDNIKKDKDFLSITRKIDSIIYNQKFEGATVGIFNHNIIARDLGLTEKTDNKNEHSGTLTIKRKVIK